MTLRIKLSTIRTVVFGLILLVVGGGVGYTYAKRTLTADGGSDLPQVVVNQQVPSDYQAVDFSLFWEVWRKLEREYLDPQKIDAQEMVYGAVTGMVASLKDPYTVYLPPKDQLRTEEDLSGAFEGVGIELGYVSEQLAVVAPLKGMPAEAAGIQAGDLILHLKDETKDLDIDTIGMSLSEAVSYIRGKHGVPITLTMYRTDGVAPFDVTIERDTIVVPSVELEFHPNKDGNGEIAHISLSRFGGRTEEEWRSAVDEIKAKSDVDGIILDMRNNPGGYLDGAVYIASEFIKSGLIVQEQGRLRTQDYNVNRTGRLYDLPVVVLVNRGSASASEIVAGALRDRLDAVIVGTKTFGKGTVQRAEELRDSSGLHITTARWLLPGGDWIHEKGIEPSIEATNSADTPDVDEMVEAALGAF